MISWVQRETVLSDRKVTLKQREQAPCFRENLALRLAEVQNSVQYLWRKCSCSNMAERRISLCLYVTFPPAQKKHLKDHNRVLPVQENIHSVCWRQRRMIIICYTEEREFSQKALFINPVQPPISSSVLIGCSGLLTASGRAGGGGNGGRPVAWRTQRWARPGEDGWPLEGWEARWAWASAYPGRSCSWGSLLRATARGRRGTAPIPTGRRGCRRSCTPGKGRWGPWRWGSGGTAAAGQAGGTPGGRRTAGWTCRDRGAG